MTKILFCSFKYDYGKPSLGLSMEYANFFDALKRMPGVEAEFFATDEQTSALGREEMNRLLIATVEETKPDLLFCFLFSEELEKETISYITKKTKTKTFNWFADDHWRIPVFSRYWASLFTMVSTTDSSALEIYRHYGITNVIKTQWAANTFLYQPAGKSENRKIGSYNITFVGKNYGNRGKYIDYLRNHRLPAESYGNGWPAGRASQQKMLEIFSYSKINLNFSETHNYGLRGLLRNAAKLVVKKQQGSLRFDGHHLVSNARAFLSMRRRAIKGRTFEIPACGGFLLTQIVDDNLAEYYELEKEIAVFKNAVDMAEKCRYFLVHEEQRKQIAQAGYQRTIKEHTYQRRFVDIFSKIM